MKTINKPPFEINDNIINLVADINKKLGKLEVNIYKTKDLQLRKISRIKSVNTSCAIEANLLTESEVADIINGKKLTVNKKESIEIENAYRAYEKLDYYKPYKLESFLNAHKILMQSLVNDNGYFRKEDVGVFENKNVIHIGARPNYIGDLIIELFDWGKTSNLNPLIKACVIHYEIELIHPFSDGNGRIGRLWQLAILYNYNKIFEYIPIETLVYENQERYYNAIEESRKINCSTPFIEYMLEMISLTIDSFDINVIVLNGINNKYLKSLTRSDTEFLIILIICFDKREYITIENLKEIFNKTVSVLERKLKKLVEATLIFTTGNATNRKYKINKEIIK